MERNARVVGAGRASSVSSFDNLIHSHLICNTRRQNRTEQISKEESEIEIYADVAPRLLQPQSSSPPDLRLFSLSFPGKTHSLAGNITHNLFHSLQKDLLPHLLLQLQQRVFLSLPLFPSFRRAAARVPSFFMMPRHQQPDCCCHRFSRRSSCCCLRSLVAAPAVNDSRSLLLIERQTEARHSLAREDRRQASQATTTRLVIAIQ